MMRARELENGSRLVPLKFPLDEVPHLVIEPNLTCNLRCRSCYNRSPGVVKSLEMIRSELDFASTQRKLETVSLLGGEPTLHPDLPEIVAEVKRRGLTCQILTNGLVLHQDSSNELLDRLIGAGLNRILLHADVGQPRSGIDLSGFIRSLFERFEERRLYFGLAVTIYPENRARLPELARRYARYRFFDGILATLSKDTARTTQPLAPPAEVDLLTEHRAMASGLGVFPTTYVPSSLDDLEVTWLVYFYYLNPDTGAAFAISPRLNRVFRRFYRRLTGRHFFAMTAPAWLFRLNWFLTMMMELTLKPGRLGELARLLHQAGGLNRLRFHYVVVQSGPEWNVRAQQIQMCYHCPDATVRDGRLMPVCVADLIRPLGSASPPLEANRRLRETVHAHLEAS